MKIGSENIEEVLFDYFEGNLSEEQKNEVKQFIDDNPVYLEDFRLWEVSNARQFISEPVAIDKTLLKNTKVTRAKLLLWASSFVVIGVILMTVFYGRKNEKVKNYEEKQVIQKLEEEKTASTVHITHNLGLQKVIKSVGKNSLKIVNKENEISEQYVDQLNGHFLEDSLVEKEDKGIPLIPMEEDSSVGHQLETNAQIKNDLSKRQFRKEAREIEKYKQRVIEKRKQEELMKGNTPYVVPLNPNGF